MKKLLVLLLLCFPFAVIAEEDCPYSICFGINWETATIGDINGVDVKMRSKHGRTPLHLAAWYSNKPGVISALLNAGADIEARDIVGYTPLYSAVSSNYSEIVSVLLNAGADIKARSVYGATPLHWAARFTNDPKIIEILLKAGSNPKAKNSIGETAFVFMQINKKLRGTPIYWKLADLSFD